MTDKLVRPIKVTSEPHYDFFEIMEYMEKKYNFQHRDMGRRWEWIKSSGLEDLYKLSFYHKSPKDYTPEEKLDHERYTAIMQNEPPYQDYWHEMCDGLNGNGSYLYYDWHDMLEYHEDEGHPEWKKEICRYFITEYGEEAREMKFWVEW